MTDLFLGVDGGGTKTEFVCIDVSGAVLAQVTAKSTYHLEVGFEEAVRRIGEGVSAICVAAGITTDAVRHAFFGLPAYGEDRAVDPRLHAACGAILGHRRYMCGNDMVCGWAGSLGCRDGINIVAGTGSIGYGERSGRTARAGGWGEVFGDEGSAYWIAMEGLKAFARMSDGREVKTSLHERITSALSLTDDIELCERVMGRQAMTRAEIAGLAPLVSSAADDGDAGAIAILNSAAGHLYELVRALRTSLGYCPSDRVAISWSGSVLTKIEPVRHRFLDLLRQANGYDFVAPVYSPAYGAALYARLHAERSPG